MKHLKILGLGLMAAAALMAFVGAGTASATVLSNATGNMKVGEEIHAVIEPGTTAELEAGFITVTCTAGTIKGTISNAGSNTTTVSGTTSAVTFSSCNCEPITVTNGSLEIHYISGTKGTLTASGFTATVPCNTIFGKVTCKYITGNNKDMGILTGSKETGATATMDVETALTREEGSSELCNASATWKAKYIVTTPDELNVTTG
jgi:hypothetical protein